MQLTKQQVEEKLSAVAVLRNAPGVDRTVISDVEATLSTVMALSSAREHKLQHALQLVVSYNTLYAVRRVETQAEWVFDI